jgi:H+/Cl- antiporter ClcA
VTRPLESIRKLPALGVLAERQLGGFLLASAVIGVGVGLGAAALVQLLEWVQETIFPLGLESGKAWVFLTIPVGLLVSWFLAKQFAPEIAEPRSGQFSPVVFTSVKIRFAPWWRREPAPALVRRSTPPLPECCSRSK